MIEKKKKWKLADFDYPLPEKYIAQYPAKRRDLSKLMVIHKETGEIEHKIFSNLPDYLRKNDLVITNNTKVFPARLYASKDRTEAKVEVFLLRELENDFRDLINTHIQSKGGDPNLQYTLNTDTGSLEVVTEQQVQQQEGNQSNGSAPNSEEVDPTGNFKFGDESTGAFKDGDADEV